MFELFFNSLLVLILLLGVSSTVKVSHTLRKYRAPHYPTDFGNDIDLPSVSICIPARNERHALTTCLEAVLSSTYQRQEVLVLDDASGDDTSALIKSFASEGVRFVKGTPLPDGWLGKNHALQTLLEEASGTYILYIDVDTRIKPKTVEYFIRYALSHRLEMLSVLPRREDGWRASVLWSPLRYFWSVLFYSKHSVSTSSSAWLIRRDTLQQKLQGFSTIKESVQPQQVFADTLRQTGSYAYLISNGNFGVGYEKKWRSQLLTAVRSIVPSFRGSPFLAFISIVLLGLLLTPYVAIASLLVDTLLSWATIILACVSIAVWSVVYGIYTHSAWHHGWWAGAVLWPLIVAQEIILIFSSLYAYTFRTLRWKGRSIHPQAEN